jgi:hypothetical protein
MDNTNQINKNKDNEIATTAISYDILFSGDDFGLFVFKRTEKISTAVYLLTEYLSDTEPMKWSMRQVATRVVGEATILSKRVWGQREYFSAILSSFSELTTLFYVANMAHMISPMNFEIIQAELSKMVTMLSQAISKNTADRKIIADDYFNVSTGQDYSKNIFTGTQHFDKGQMDIRDKHVLYKNDHSKTGNTESHQKDRNNRQDTILTLLKEGKVLTIKDFSSQIKDCSEKTIQRELLSLVAKNVLKKEGERRWSRYSLV